ncbi:MULTISPECIES: NAD(P)/FAD-dependent oxidoreductase [unclassified Pseudomonas]|uniref:NAD(P)/FAD-dependent oxidoreductase n=1 Tax=unclassified Pseudomonas TaxID=196821 RepID=UPI0018E7AF26|nr:MULTISPECIES: FAD-dependent oxidoreductase [unclassified Pseudomonas]MBJ2303759.1 FAD-dependent oxidoreductase [Pseudomonas sp. MF2846]MBK3490248.1 FAD-dependent oxidoreductase [Pseudomonas sp. MF2857]
MSHSDSPCTLIVGSGHAGCEAAFALRQNGYTGRVVLVGNEASLPYQRPPLSKGFLAGALDDQALLIRPAAAYEKANIETRMGVQVVALNAAHKTVELSDGSTLSYSHLILATGSRPRHLVDLDPDLPLANLHYLRTLAHAQQLREQMLEGKRLIIIGGGYIGLEVAAVAIKRGVKVILIESMDRILARVTAPEVSTFYQQVHQAEGAILHLNAQLERLNLNSKGERVESVQLRDGSVFPADLVLVGIGAIANTELAEQAGLEIDNGIVVDENTHTSDPFIHAVGDCCNHPSEHYSRRLRLESIPNAIEQARTAALAICAKPVPYRSVPWFWSDQYDLKLQTVGLSQGHDQTCLRGSPALRSFVVFYLREGVVIAADCINRPLELALIKKLVHGRLAPDIRRLTDDSMALKDILAQSTTSA